MADYRDRQKGEQRSGGDISARNGVEPASNFDAGLFG